MKISSATLLWLLVLPLSAAELPEDWAYSKVTAPGVPGVRHSADVRNPIDAFVLARLESQNLPFSPPADRLTLLRRVYFDLVGLPPTPEEIDAFLSDSSPKAFETVVDRLLKSPGYAEKAALAWLDLVRYAESDGFKADDPRPNAWRYRDYVIRSFAADKPYDRFIKEQIAGDELWPEDPEALVATGFLRHYPDEYNAVNLEQRRQEILNDITDTVSTTFLGITVGCAKCHDHKFDPITQEDYYRLQAFFAGWGPKEVVLSSAEERAKYQEALRKWEADTAELRQEIAAIEKPFREKYTAKQRFRFPEEYARLLDLPEAQRNPLEKQLAGMISKQVYVSDNGMLAGMKPPEKEKYDALKKKLPPAPKAPPVGMVMTDIGTTVPTTFFLKRGNWQKKGREVRPGFLSAFDDRLATIPLPKSGSTTGRRSVLAEWLVAPENPLTARVIVNRLWQQHFGTGIVGTSGDLGTQGDRPTHPELLDWLAGELLRRKWSLKEIHRLIVTSATYQQSSTHREDAAKVDPDNKLLWKQNRRRLEGETLRDSILSIAGLLNRKMFGPSIYPELPEELQKTSGWPTTADVAEKNRRSIYVAVRRNLRYPLFLAFDATDRTETCSRRFITTTAPQALMLLNEKRILEQAENFADRVKKDAGDKPDAILERAFRLALGRSPQTEERVLLRKFLESADKAAVTDLCHALLNLNEFIRID